MNAPKKKKRNIILKFNKNKHNSNDKKINEKNKYKPTNEEETKINEIIMRRKWNRKRKSNNNLIRSNNIRIPKAFNGYFNGYKESDMLCNIKNEKQLKIKLKNYNSEQIASISIIMGLENGCNQKDATKNILKQIQSYHQNKL